MITEEQKLKQSQRVHQIVAQCLREGSHGKVSAEFFETGASLCIEEPLFSLTEFESLCKRISEEMNLFLQRYGRRHSTLPYIAHFLYK